MHTKFRKIVLLLTTATLGLAGCPGPQAPDSHPEAFQTARQASVKHLAEQLEATKDLTIDIVKFERPDVTATKGDAGTINLDADGQHKSVDLAPLQGALLVEGAKKRDILLSHLHTQLAPFDQDRLRAMGFEKAKTILQPRLVSREELRDLAQPLGPTAALHSVNVIADLTWTPMAELGGGAPPQPVSAQVLADWKVDWPAVDKAALENLKPALTEANLLTTSFAPMGKAGGIAPGANPAIILLPGFLPLVQKTWQSQDSLVILASSARDIRFVDQHNEKLLAVLYPGWQSRAKSLRDPLSTLPILLDDKGFSVFDYTAPSSKPATQAAPSTKPVFIVH